MTTQPGRPTLTRRLRPARGFTLIEVLVTIAIVVVVLGVFVASLLRGTDNSRAATVIAAAAQVRTAIHNYAIENGGAVPVTESATAGGIRVTGTLASAAPIGVLSAAATLEVPLFATRAMDKLLRINFAGNPAPTNPNSAPLLWDTTQQKFYMSPDAAPTRSYALCNRVEAAIVARGTPYDFTPDGTTPLDVGRTVSFLVIPQCPAAVAYQISLKSEGSSKSSSATTADTVGRVLYAAPVATVTTVYIYLLDL